jgi:2-(1,2-epoxy-1,2-dihydrophenyl)acetyl-CoA isomerase
MEFDQYVATITLDIPQRCNALDRDDVAELRRCLDLAVHPGRDVRALVITGAGDVFCSGLNLCRMVASGTGMAEQEGEIKRQHFGALMLRLADFRIPTIAAVNGPAVGAGMSLVVACTMAVMGSEAYLDPSFPRLGMVPDGGLTYYLPRRVGSARAARILLTGERITADAAVQMGLATDVVEPQAVLHEALRIAHQIAHLSAASARTYGLLRASYDRTLSDQLVEERRVQTAAIASPECREGVRAFFEKRTPVF